MVGVTIIGVGRVGGAMALSLPKGKYSVENLVNRGDPGTIPEMLRSGPTLATLDDLPEISSSLIFTTVPDGEIASVARALAAKIRNSPYVFHTSGSLSSSILSPLKAAGCKIGSIHPLVSISRPEFGPARFRGAFFCVEGDEQAVAMGKEVVSDLGGRSFSIDTQFKTLYHAAAVTACGHSVALFDAAVEIMTKCGVSAEDAKDFLLPLVTSTVQNLAEQTTAAALTGTFARADLETLTRHLTALNENVSDDLLEIYLLLGERSLELAAKQGVSTERIETLRTKVAIAKSKLKW